MDTVKATININGGFIQLEGPQEFVEKYLEQYKPAIEKWQKSPMFSDDNIQGKKEEPKITPAKRSRISTKSGCSERIRALIEDNYFSEPRTINDIVAWLKDQKSATYQSNQVSAVLSNIIKSKQPKIRRFKQDGVYKYCNI